MLFSVGTMESTAIFGKFWILVTNCENDWENLNGLDSILSCIVHQLRSFPCFALRIYILTAQDLLRHKHAQSVRTSKTL